MADSKAPQVGDVATIDGAPFTVAEANEARVVFHDADRAALSDRVAAARARPAEEHRAALAEIPRGTKISARADTVYFVEETGVWSIRGRVLSFADRQSLKSTQGNAAALAMLRNLGGSD